MSSSALSAEEQLAREWSTRQINRQPYVKLLFFLRKAPGVSDEYFHTHWSTVHADLSTSNAAFVLASRRYVQFHVTQATRALANSLSGPAPDGMQVLDYDGISELWVKDWPAWLALAGSAEFAAAFADDTKKFVQLPCKIMVGYDDLVYGAALSGTGGADGMAVVIENGRTHL